MAKVRMKVLDVFHVGEKTIFAGELETTLRFVAEIDCVLEMDGQRQGTVRIGGEVHGGGANRDLWTTTPVSLNGSEVHNHSVWLFSE